MPGNLVVRESSLNDTASIERLYPDAFPDEDLLPLVKELLAAEQGVLSLVGTVGQELASHCIFTMCGISGAADKLALLGPLAVAPARQRGGIGSALVRTGLQRLENAGVKQVNVLGDPAYYGRFGFAADDRVAPPYPIPDEWREAWQFVVFKGSDQRCSGQLSVPSPWHREALWGS